MKTQVVGVRAIDQAVQPFRPEQVRPLDQLQAPVAVCNAPGDHLTDMFAHGLQPLAGRPQPLWLAGCRLDLGRLLAAVVEQHYDGHGIIWPAACAPLDVHLVALDLRQPEVAAQAEALYERLSVRGLAVLYDDRDLSAGVKFADADLIGLPLRLTVSKRSVQEGQVEAKWRHSADRRRLDDDALAAELAILGAK